MFLQQGKQNHSFPSRWVLISAFPKPSFLPSSLQTNQFRRTSYLCARDGVWLQEFTNVLYHRACPLGSISHVVPTPLSNSSASRKQAVSSVQFSSVQLSYVSFIRTSPLCAHGRAPHRKYMINSCLLTPSPFGYKKRGWLLASRDWSISLSVFPTGLYSPGGQMLDFHMFSIRDW